VVNKAAAAWAGPHLLQGLPAEPVTSTVRSLYTLSS
jgi:hypothetical protein